MYCQNCGKEIEKNAEQCPHCESVIPNIFVPNLYGGGEADKEKPTFTIRAVKPEPRMKWPSPLSLRVTGIVMYAVALAYFGFEFIRLLCLRPSLSYDITARICVYGLLTALFCLMLFLSIFRQLDKRISGAALIAVNLIGIGHLVRDSILCIYHLRDFDGLQNEWQNILFLTVYPLLGIALIVVTVFAFFFYFHRIFSPLPMCISTGIFLILDILSLVASIVYWVLIFNLVDIHTTLFFLTVYTYYGITIAQLFLFYKQDKYRVWKENRE